jgi:L-ascorbate metabolism protein UlaG (beta-lactamase superfamily)
MKRIATRLLAVLGTVLLCALGWLAWQVNHPPSLAPYAAQWLPAAQAQPGKLRVRFLGVSTLLFDDGETAILTDGFFSRPAKTQVLFGKVAPDPVLIAQSLRRAGITQLSAVLVGHSHYDHAMDAPEVARRTGAVLIGSPSTAQIGRGWGLAEDRIRVAADGDSMQFGRFRVSFIRSQHVPSAVTGGEISAPLAPPVRAHEYREGGSYSLLIRHGVRSLLVQESAGFVEGALRGRQAEVVLLGIGLLGKQADSYRDAYWRETVTTVGARRVIPIHWDDFSLPLSQPLRPLPPPLDDFDASMAFLNARAQTSGVDVKLAPAWTLIDPWDGLRAQND